VDADEPLRERARGEGDDRDLEHRPAEALEHVEPCREIGAALAERGSLEHHRGHARVGADVRSDAEHRVPEQSADHGREQRLPKGKPQVRRSDEHEQRDAEVRPQEQRVERPEHAQAVRDGLDSPRRRCVCHVLSLRRY
jgi:hypothetical protein